MPYKVTCWRQDNLASWNQLTGRRMTAEENTIEELIAAGYETNAFSDECLRQIEAVVSEAVRSKARKTSPLVADDLEQRAGSHVWEKLNRKMFDPSQRFRPWCFTVVGKLLLDCARRRKRERVRPLDDIAAVEGSAFTATGRDLQPVSGEFLERFVNAVPGPLNRIIVATQTQLIDGLDDDLLGQWCDEAGQGDIVAELRKISLALGVSKPGALKMLADVLEGVSYADIRQRASRAKTEFKRGFRGNS